MAELDALTVSSSSSSSKSSCHSSSYNRSCIAEDDLLSDPMPIIATIVVDEGNGVVVSYCIVSLHSAMVTVKLDSLTMSLFVVLVQE